MRDTSAEIGELQAGIDKTLDKIRVKVLDKSLEAEILTEKYKLMLEAGEEKLKNVCIELSPADLGSGLQSRGTEEALS